MYINEDVKIVKNGHIYSTFNFLGNKRNFSHVKNINYINGLNLPNGTKGKLIGIEDMLFSRIEYYCLIRVNVIDIDFNKYNKFRIAHAYQKAKKYSYVDIVISNIGLKIDKSKNHLPDHLFEI